MKLAQSILILCCAPLALHAACSVAPTLPCSRGDNTSCVATAVCVSIPNAVAFYDNGETVNDGGTATPVDVPFGTFNGNLRDPIVKNYAFTVGTFNPMGTVLIHATDDSGQTQTAFALHDTNGHYIPVDISYLDCINTLHAVTTTTDLPLDAAQSSMVVTSGYPAGEAPCHPYNGAAVGSGAGQLSFTIPALTSGSHVAGTYTDTVTLIVTAN